MLRLGYGQVSPRSERREQEARLWAAGCESLYFDDKSDSQQKHLADALLYLEGYSHRWLSRDPPTIVVCSLDRLCSSITLLLEISAQLQEHHIVLESLDEKMMTDGGEIYFRADDLARFRKANAADKSQRGILVAEKRGRQTGRRPALTQAKLAEAIKDLVSGSPVANVAKSAGVSVPTLYRYLAAYRQ